MDETLLGVLGIVAMLGLIALGLNIAYAVGLVGIVGIIVMTGRFEPAGSLAAGLQYIALTHYHFSVFPLFILMGYFAWATGISDELFTLFRRWVGHFRGGLPIATVGTCAGFAAMSGSSVASVASIGKIAIPEMRKYGVSKAFASAVVGASGTLSSLIPPSGIMVIYGIVAEQSIGKLLIAGIIPGILSALIYMGNIYIRVRLNNNLAPPASKSSWKDRMDSVKPVWAFFFIVFLMLGGIYGGVFTPTEAGAIGAVGILLIGLVRRKLRIRTLKDALLDGIQVVCMVMLILICALVFMSFIDLTGLPMNMAAFFAGLEVPRIVVLMGMLALYVLLGCILEGLALIMVTVPIVMPTLLALGYDPIWFGIILVKMVEIGLITPPIGLNCIVVHGIFPDVPLIDIFKGIGWFFIMDLLTVVILIAFPDIILFLPAHMFKLR